MTPALLTPSLLLRPLEHEDAGALTRVYQDPRVARGVCAVPQPFTPLHAAAHILLTRAGDMRGTDWVWGIEGPEGDLIGEIGLSRKAQSDSGRAHLGYAIAAPFWNQGFATQAIGAVIQWATRQGGLTHITTDAFADCPASQRVLSKTGFVATGSVPRFSLARGETALAETYVRRLQAPAPALQYA